MKQISIYEEITFNHHNIYSHLKIGCGDRLTIPRDPSSHNILVFHDFTHLWGRADYHPKCPWRSVSLDGIWVSKVESRGPVLGLYTQGLLQLQIITVVSEVSKPLWNVPLMHKQSTSTRETQDVY